MIHRHRSCMLVVCLAAQILAEAAQSSVARWREAIVRGDENRRLGKYVEARQSYLEALAEAEKFGPNDLGLAATLNNLAALLFDYGKDAEAESLYRRCCVMQRCSCTRRSHRPRGLVCTRSRFPRLSRASRRSRD